MKYVFVCTNRRSAHDPLGAGCGDRGEAVYEALRAEIGRRGAWRSVWLARSGCIGVCPKKGCTVVAGSARYDEVSPADAKTLIFSALND